MNYPPTTSRTVVTAVTRTAQAAGSGLPKTGGSTNVLIALVVVLMLIGVGLSVGIAMQNWIQDVRRGY